jgi:hypothetical protein
VQNPNLTVGAWEKLASRTTIFLAECTTEMFKANTATKMQMAQGLKGHPATASKTPSFDTLKSCFPRKTRAIGNKQVQKHSLPSAKRQVRFSSANNVGVNVSVCEIIRPASDMSPSERQDMWYQRDEFVKCITEFVETLKAYRKCNLTTPVSYSSVLQAVYDDCCKVADEDTSVSMPQSLATLVALSASVHDLRGLERNVEKNFGSQQKSHMKKRIGSIVAMNKVLSQMTYPYEVRASQLRVLSETLSR